MISVIVPAHNEQAVIGRCLRALTEGARPGELEIIVACNGCTDGTAAVARGFEGVRVVEMEVASKVAALNGGDAVATRFPRFYVDADIVIGIAALRQLAHVLDTGRVLAVAPESRLDLNSCSRGARWYYDVDARLPSSKLGIGFAGVYGLSAEGRRRFGEFPPIIADDGFVRLQFRPEERLRLEGTYAKVAPAGTLRELVAVMTRVHYGNIELSKRYAELWASDGAGNRPALIRLLGRPWLWPKLGVYAYVKLVSRARAHWRNCRSGATKWERDETSRRIHATDKVDSDRFGRATTSED